MEKSQVTDIRIKAAFALLLTGFALMIGLASTQRNSGLLLSFTVLIGTASMTVWLFKERNTILVLIISAAFFVRYLLAIVQSYIMPLPDSGADAKVFEQLGWSVAAAWNNGTQVPGTPGAYIYSKFIGLVYYVTGRVPFIIQFINVMLGVLTVYIVYKLIIMLKDNKKAALTGAFITAFYPTLNLYSAITLRETIITFLGLISVYYLVKWLNRGSISEFLKSFILLAAACVLHGAIILLTGVYLFFFCFYRPKSGKWGFINLQTILVIMGFVVLFCLFRSVLLSKLPSDITLLFSPEYLKRRLEPLAVGRGAYLAGYYPGSIIDIILQTPVRVVHFLFMPFPWKVTGLADFIGFIDVFLYAILIVYTARAFRNLDRHGRFICLAILSVALVEVIIFAWGTSNFGTAIRHRQKIVCLFITMASLGIMKNGELKANNG